MHPDLPSLNAFLKLLQQVPYLASKNLYRVTAHFLNMEPQRAEKFCQALLEAKQRITKCAICFSWQEVNYPCSWCSASARDQTVICVVESWQELIAIEKTGGYTGVYHVLGGAICPLEGIGPEQLTIEPLIERLNNETTELILATNQTPEGQATAAYIVSKIPNKQLLVSCLARGVPVGSSLEYIDRLTVYKALSERRPF
ncbi:recombination protein RecR [Candidatus Dependentiae bacterium]|nr:recombination protein RecR [Candidatus Dependentiae bacterium]MCC7414876.1 recombination protein RecR [Campylobacterota bacterium]